MIFHSKRKQQKIELVARPGGHQLPRKPPRVPLRVQGRPLQRGPSLDSSSLLDSGLRLGISACSLGCAFSLIQLSSEYQGTARIVLCVPNRPWLLLFVDHTMLISYLLSTSNKVKHITPTTAIFLQQKCNKSTSNVLDIFLQEIHQSHANADIMTNLYDPFQLSIRVFIYIHRI